MKRFINARFFLFGAVGLILGVLCAYWIMYGKFVAPIVMLGVLVVAFVLLLVFKSKLQSILLVTLIFAILGCGVFHINLASNQKEEIIARPVTLSGRVTDIGRNGKKTNVVYLEDCTCDENAFGGRVRVVVYDGDNFSTGDVVTFDGILRSVYVFADEPDTFSVRDNVKYELTDTTLLGQVGGKLKLDETIRKYIYDVTVRYMPNHSGVMYALITGDDNALDDVVKALFQRAGIIHLLAVSGMHLVYIITIVGFFINKLKLHPLLEFAIMIVPLVLFCYVCDWVPSIIRALLMTTCAYVVKWLLGRYDMLISLSWSVLITLVINPCYLFDIGWQLSVLSVFGMATLHLRIDRFLQSKNLKKFWYGFFSSISLSLSCTLATFVPIAVYFGEVPILGVLANIVAVPLMSWTFTLGVVGLLPWVFHYALHPADFLITIVVKIAKFVAELNFAVVSVTALAIAIVVSVVWLFVAGEYVNIGKKARIICHCVLCVLLVLCFVFAGIKLPLQKEVFVTYTYDGADVVATNSNGEVVVVSNGNRWALGKIEDYLKRFDYDSCTWVFTDWREYTDFDEKDNYIVDHLKVNQVYCLGYYGNDALADSFATKGVTVIQPAKNSWFGKDIQLKGLYDGTLSAVMLQIDDISIAIAQGDEIQTNHLAEILSDSDLFIMQSLTDAFLDEKFTTLSFYQDYCKTNFGFNKYGAVKITSNNGKMILNFDD